MSTDNNQEVQVKILKEIKQLTFIGYILAAGIMGANYYAFRCEEEIRSLKVDKAELAYRVADLKVEIKDMEK